MYKTHIVPLFITCYNEEHGVYTPSIWVQRPYGHQGFRLQLGIGASRTLQPSSDELISLFVGFFLWGFCVQDSLGCTIAEDRAVPPILVRFKIYSLLKGHWSLWVFERLEFRVPVLRDAARPCTARKNEETVWDSALRVVLGLGA